MSPSRLSLDQFSNDIDGVLVPFMVMTLPDVSRGDIVAVTFNSFIFRI